MTAKRTADCDEALVYEIACNEQAEEEDAYLAECERRGVKPEKPKRLSKTETCIRIGTLKGIEIGTRKGVQMCQPKIDALKRERDDARSALVKATLNGKKPRAGKGNPLKRTKAGWRLQKEMADDFSKCAFNYGGKTYGAMTEEKAKDWETRYPDANKRERKSGYYSEMRRIPDLKQEYFNAAGRWNDYWRTFKKDFSAWLRDNPHGTIDLFKVTWTPPGKTVAMSLTDKTLRYGADTRFADSPDGNDI